MKQKVFLYGLRVESLLMKVTLKNTTRLAVSLVHKGFLNIRRDHI